MAKSKQGTRQLVKITQLCSWNSRSLCSDITSGILVEDLKRRRISLCAIQESHLRGKSSASLSDYTLLSSVDITVERTSAGVGFLVSTPDIRVTDFMTISEKNAVIWVLKNETYIKVASTYAFTENSETLEYVRYIEQLKLACKSHKVKRKFPEGCQRSECMQSHRLLQCTVKTDRASPTQKSCRNGELLAELLSDQNPRVENSFFTKKLSTKLSWRHQRTN